MESEEYEKTGNAEQMLNVGVYAGLELLAPEHPNHHFDATVDSVTRGKV